MGYTEDFEKMREEFEAKAAHAAAFKQASQIMRMQQQELDESSRFARLLKEYGAGKLSAETAIQPPSQDKSSRAKSIIWGQRQQRLNKGETDWWLRHAAT